MFFSLQIKLRYIVSLFFYNNAASPTKPPTTSSSSSTPSSSSSSSTPSSSSSSSTHHYKPSPLPPILSQPLTSPHGQGKWSYAGESGWKEYPKTQDLRWHRRTVHVMHNSKQRKLPKTVLLRTVSHDFLPNLYATHKIFSVHERGPITAVCHFKVALGLLEGARVKYKNFYGPNQLGLVCFRVNRAPY